MGEGQAVFTEYARNLPVFQKLVAECGSDIGDILCAVEKRFNMVDPAKVTFDVAIPVLTDMIVVGMYLATVHHGKKKVIEEIAMGNYDSLPFGPVPGMTS